MRKEATSTHAAPLKRSRINERKAATTAITTPRSKAPTSMPCIQPLLSKSVGSPTFSGIPNHRNPILTHLISEANEKIETPI
ncbi:hypothetical protein QLX08_001071 [Tetragonisca angustula]|uniref:Uncharacterized protein n=1 Tax=Tetragonisca angustula TaxID=166442 RepID=A0AAW1AKQ5_9HYME